MDVLARLLRRLLGLDRRGPHSFVGPSLECRFPFGLASVETRSFETSEVLVFPQRGRLLRRILPAGPRRDQPIGRRVALGRGLDEFRSLREFRPGDNARQIHWRTTARRGELYVRDMEREQRQTGTLLLDTFLPRPERGRVASSGPAPNADFELAVSFAAAIATDVIRRGGTLGFAAYDEDQDSGETQLRVQPDVAGEEGLHQLLALLARLRPTHSRPAADLLSELPSAVGRGTRWVAVLLDGASKRALLSAMPEEAEVEAYVVTEPEFSQVFCLSEGDAPGAS